MKIKRKIGVFWYLFSLFSNMGEYKEITFYVKEYNFVLKIGIKLINY